MKTFTVNKKTYPIREFDFNFMCDLEDRGISIENIGDKPLKILREYLATVAGISSEAAGKELEMHVIGGGKMEDLYGALNIAMEESGFFRAATQSQTEEGSVEETKK